MTDIALALDNDVANTLAENGIFNLNQMESKALQLRQLTQKTRKTDDLKMLSYQI